jgi:hypothetical protein
LLPPTASGLKFQAPKVKRPCKKEALGKRASCTDGDLAIGRQIATHIHKIVWAFYILLSGPGGFVDIFISSLSRLLAVLADEISTSGNSRIAHFA